MSLPYYINEYKVSHHDELVVASLYNNSDGDWIVKPVGDYRDYVFPTMNTAIEACQMRWSTKDERILVSDV